MVKNEKVLMNLYSEPLWGWGGVKAIWAMPKYLQHEFEEGFPKAETSQLFKGDWNEVV